MKSKLLLILALFIFISGFGQEKQLYDDLQISDDIISEKQKDLIIEKVKVFPNNTELAISIIKEGNPYFLGVKRLNDTLHKINNAKAIFEIGSITKIFTSTILANLVLKNELNLNDPIQQYFDFDIANDEISLLQLANHTSGLPKLPSNLNLETEDQSNPYKNYDEQKLKEYLKDDMKVVADPGTTYEYSNIGAGILGYLLENKTHSSYEKLLQKYIFSKYEMVNSTTNRENIKQRLVQGVNAEGIQTSNWDLNSLIAAGGILSNTEDLSKFALAQFNDSNVELNLTRESTFNIPQHQMQAGLGWKIMDPGTGIKIFAHNGGTGGYSSMIMLDTVGKNGIIILSNVSAFNKNAGNIDQLSFGLMQSIIKNK